jgi:hypothetical protein
MSRKICSIVWDGLQDGPRYAGKNPELKNMTKEFLSKYKKMDDPIKFGEEMRDFAEEHGFEVEDNVYLDDHLTESMSEEMEKKFKQALKEGKVKFEYKKVDGSIRKALGTLNPELMPGTGATEKKIEDGKKKRFVPPSILIYFDLESEGFRSFRKDNFIKFEEVK